MESKSQEKSLSYCGGGENIEYHHMTVSKSLKSILIKQPQGSKHFLYIETKQIKFQAKLSQFKLSFDRLATYVFPLLFFAFNLCYWAVYLVIMPYFIEDRERAWSKLEEFMECVFFRYFPSHHSKFGLCRTHTNFKKDWRLIMWKWVVKTNEHKVML